MSPTKPLMTSSEIIVLLRRRHGPPEWAFIPQVRDKTGAHNARTADAVAMGLWPSRGLHLHGFEIKVSLGDWRRELGNPAKAEVIAAFCHFWWIVAPKGVIPLEELPENWGLIEATKKRLVAVKPATELEAQTPDYPFLAALLRRAQEAIVPRAEIDAKMDLARGEIEKRVNESADWKTKHLREDYERLEKAVKEFEKASGIKIERYGYNSREKGEHFQEAMLLMNKGAAARRKIRDVIKYAKVHVEAAREALDDLAAAEEKLSGQTTEEGT